MSGRILFVLQVVLVVFLTGCGYHNPYYLGGVDKSESARKLYLVMWENQTNELGLESTVHQTLNRFFKRSPVLRLVRNLDDADLILRGKIEAINLPGMSYGSNDQAQEAEATLSVSFSLTSGIDGKKIITNNIVLRKRFVLASDAATTRDNKRNALRELNDDLAREIYHAVLDDQKPE